MIEKCNFRRDGTKAKGIYCGLQNGKLGEGFCSKEENCILYQIYKEVIRL